MKNKVTPHPRLQQGKRALKKQGRESARVFAVTSGKGGVGKTNITANLAISLARLGERVCVFDADTGLANINILLGFTPEHTLEDLINGKRSIEEIILELPEGIAVVPAASGIAECVDLTEKQQHRLFNAIRRLEKQFDYILIDTSAGIAQNVVDFVCAAPFPLMVISSEPTSLTDAYALLRVLLKNGLDQPVHVLVNNVTDFKKSRVVFTRFRNAVEKYLHVRVRYIGFITEDDNVPTSVRLQCPVVVMKPDAPASRCFKLLAEYIDEKLKDSAGSLNFSQYWNDQVENRSNDMLSEQTSTAIKLDEIGDAFHTCMHDDNISQPAARAAILNLLKIYSERYAEPIYDPLPELMIALNSGRYESEQLEPLINHLSQHYAELTLPDEPVESEQDTSEFIDSLRLATIGIQEQQNYLRESLITIAERIDTHKKK